jgi:hypothetical protein
MRSVEIIDRRRILGSRRRRPNRAITWPDRMMQQTTLLAREISAAPHEVSGNVTQLKEPIGFFRILAWTMR